MAGNGESFLHRANPLSKIFMTALIIAGIVISRDTARLSALLAIIMAMLLLSGNSMKELLHLAVYPVFFSSIFAAIQLQQSIQAALAIIIKATGASMALLLLISTTSYVDIFSFLSLFLPSILVDIFLFTYRSLFILFDKFENLMKSIKLKGGFHPLRLLFNIKNTAGMLGVLLIHCIDMSERMYRVYSLRGYNGRIPLVKNSRSLKPVDFMLTVGAIIILTGMVIPWSL